MSVACNDANQKVRKKKLTLSLADTIPRAPEQPEDQAARRGHAKVEGVMASTFFVPAAATEKPGCAADSGASEHAWSGV